MLDVSIGGALLAGLLSFVSPCVLPIVPPYLAWLAGVSFDELKAPDQGAAQRRRVILAAVAFVLGFTTVFVGLGATASVIGRTIAQYFDTLSVIAGIVIILMGLHFLGVFRIALLYREARVQVDRKPAGLAGAYIMGRKMFSAEEGSEWDLDWTGWWGSDPPYHAPTYVLTHYPRAPLEMEGGTTFHFVTDGIESALRQARAVAGAKDVKIGGGVSTPAGALVAKT